MVFSSLPFLFFFLPAVLLCYYLLPKRFRNAVLFIFSLVFYAWGEPVYVFLMLFTTLVDYTNGRLVDRYRHSRVITRLCVVCTVVVNLSVLGFFKYSGFLLSSLNAVTGLSLPVPALTLPIGISFYTFESMSYTIDIYRGQAPVQKSFLKFGTYISLFPHLVAGPIVRYKDLALQIESRQESPALFAEGCERFVIGLFKKVLIANNVAMLAQRVQFSGSPSMLSAWLGILCFTFQIYFDFSGYSDMAIGLGRMFGFIIPENFNYPYISLNVSEFWRRWHITLGTWFREYLYIPLGGNRGGRLNTVRNLAIVWALTGLWHGASWNFVLWGSYFGLLIICERLFLLKLLEKLPKIIQWAYSFLAVVIGWVFFSYTDLSAGIHTLSAMFGFAKLYDSLGLYGLRTFWPILIIAAVCSTPLAKKATQKLRLYLPGKAAWVTGCTALLLFTVAALVDNSYNPFLYFRF